MVKNGMKGMIFDIQRNSLVDGPGIRTAVFLKGCNLQCKWCHNPESRKKDRQVMVFADRCKGCGKCKQICKNALKSCDFCGDCEWYCPADACKVCGKEWTAAEMEEIVVKDKDFYQASGGGVTVSGGECMLQPDFLLAILQACKRNGIHTAVDTAGHVSFDVFERILPYTDLFLYDVKMMDPVKHKRYTGVDNTLILDNLEKLSKTGKEIFVRVPVVACVNDSEAEIKQIVDFVKNLGIKQIELLPYHAMGVNKAEAIGEEQEEFSAPSAELMAKLKSLL